MSILVLTKTEDVSQTLSTFYRKDSRFMCGDEEAITSGADAFSKELERLSKTAPEHGIYPVTVDPRLNNRLVEGLEHAESEEGFIDSLATLGFHPPAVPKHSVYGLVTIWLDDDDLSNPGILAWNVRTDNEGEEP